MWELTEIQLLKFSLGIAFVLAPIMINTFYLNKSRLYSIMHKVSLVGLLIGEVFNLFYLAALWVFFCIFGLFLYIITEGNLIFSIEGFATYIPFIFSLISSIWYFAGVNDLYLLGYNQQWSFYAALHSSFLGWLFVGCIAFLAIKSNSTKIYLWGSYLCFVFFMLVAFGIDGIPFINSIGVVGLSLIIPVLVVVYTLNLDEGNHLSRYLSYLSFLSIIISMFLALLNEFWMGLPYVVLGIPLMVLTHGLMNAIITVPCFYFAIRIEYTHDSNNFPVEIVS